eukprot:TRINITY_DN1235_c2_g1_i1.p1 TRINITY_DN1235_c2_g1~~TRINITY_DN1235_c2_g1_i1.p1  ORF type:complete len:703 (-),score=243.77 TRINITY_DN1235_c2_g1_i1:16-2124(-)
MLSMKKYGFFEIESRMDKDLGELSGIWDDDSHPCPNFRTHTTHTIHPSPPTGLSTPPLTTHTTPKPPQNQKMSSTHLVIGREITCVNRIEHVLDDIREDGFDFLCTNLVHPRYERLMIKKSERDEPFTRSDMVMDSNGWSNVIGKTSQWIQMDSTIPSVRRNSEEAFKQEIAWACHLSLHSLMLPAPTMSCANYARLLNSQLGATHYLKFMVHVPLTNDNFDGDDVQMETESSSSSTSSSSAISGAGASSKESNDPWEAWNKFRTYCDFHNNVSVALELTSDLPDNNLLKRWYGEPVKVLIVPTSVFLTNKRGYPVLSKKHQEFVTKMFDYDVQVLLKGTAHHNQGDQPYLQYLNFLHSKIPPMTEDEAFTAPYYDYLQAPLQPLMDNLESQTYETFEKDPIKYRQYEEAVYQALLERHSNQEEKPVVMVVGAGRGPLVRASLRAADRAEVPIQVWAVEKNPNAVVTLRNMKQTLNWGDMVTIVSSDMREWNAPCKADILVSELLGSWGDNELSPECLDGAQSFLKEEGISIPCDYTSYLAPLNSSKLFNEVKSFNDPKMFETPFVVKLHNIDLLAEPQQCFYFEHPNNDEVIDNTRYTLLEFDIESPSLLCGFGGYFESVLYRKKDGEEVIISILPATFSEGMFSWFELYIPLLKPLYLEGGSKLKVHVWRCDTKQKVWYEWAVEGDRIHNANGQSYWIGL